MLVVGHSEHPCPHSLPSRPRDVSFVQSVCKANDWMPVSRSPVLSPLSCLPSCPPFLSRATAEEIMVAFDGPVWAYQCATCSGLFLK